MYEKKLINLIFCILIILGSTSALAYPIEKTNMIVKIKPFFNPSSGKISSFSPANTEESVKSYLMSYGIDSAVTVFISDYFATEFSVGYAVARSKKNAITTITSGFPNAVGEQNTKTDINMIPISTIFQYHFAPYGGLRPYIGAGYNYTILHRSNDIIKYNNSHSLIFQAGLNIVFNDDSMICFDLKYNKIRARNTIPYKATIPPAPNPINRVANGRLNMDSLALSAGIAFNF